MSMASGVILAKQLVGAPANVVTPTALAETAKAIAEKHSDVMTIKVRMYNLRLDGISEQLLEEAIIIV